MLREVGILMEREFKIKLDNDELSKIAKLNKMDIDKLEDLDVEWVLKLLLQRYHIAG